MDENVKDTRKKLKRILKEMNLGNTVKVRKGEIFVFGAANDTTVGCLNYMGFTVGHFNSSSKDGDYWFSVNPRFSVKPLPILIPPKPVHIPAGIASVRWMGYP